jgi:hypothetical protein
MPINHEFHIHLYFQTWWANTYTLRKTRKEICSQGKGQGVEERQKELFIFLYIPAF